MELFQNDESSVKIQVNKEFAKKYEHNKRREELGYLKEKYSGLNLSDEKLARRVERLKKYGTDMDLPTDDEDATSSEDEDEDGELLTPAMETQVLKTISYIKSKKNEIYEKEKNFFDDNELEQLSSNWKGHSEKSSKNDALTLTDYHRINMVQGDVFNTNNEFLTYNQEEEMLKQQVKSAIKEEFARVEADVNDFLQKKEMTEDDITRENEEYRKFVIENLSKDEVTKQTFGDWLDDNKKEHLGEEDKFLMDYILNRGWVSKDNDEFNLEDEDSEEFDKMEEFEDSYNHRFEEPDSNLIKTYPRTIEDSVRRVSDKRKRQRLAKEQRKQEEKDRKMHELNRLKNLKKKEIEEKIKTIQEIAGKSKNSIILIMEDAFDEADFEDDYEPEKFDERMKTMFNDDFYNVKEKEKPEFEDDIDIGEIEQDSNKKRPASEISKAFDSEKIMEELYQMDYEDIVAGMPTRFKYRNVLPSTFGLTTEDLIKAEDDILSRHVSLKKLAPYRDAEKQQEDVRKLSKKSRVYLFKKQMKEKNEMKEKEQQQQQDIELEIPSKHGEKKTKILVSSSRLEAYKPKRKNK